MTSSIERSHDAAVEAEDPPGAADRDETHVALLSRLEAHGRPGGNVEAPAARLVAIEAQRRIRLIEMEMAAALDRPVAAVGDAQRDGVGAGIELDLARFREDLAGDHG